MAFMLIKQIIHAKVAILLVQIALELQIINVQVVVQALFFLRQVARHPAYWHVQLEPSEIAHLYSVSLVHLNVLLALVPLTLNALHVAEFINYLKHYVVYLVLLVNFIMDKHVWLVILHV